MFNLQTPGSSKPQANNPTTGPATITFSIPEENLHVMPRQYQAVKSHAKAPGEAHSGNGKFFLLIGGLAILLGAVIVGLLLYVRSQQSPPEAEPVATTTNTNTNTNTTPVVPTTPQNGNLATAEGRDVVRIRDITTIQQALTSYYSESQTYPQVLAGLPQKLLLTEPKDPSTAQPYIYGSDLNGQSYHIQFVLEGQAIFNNKVLTAGLHQVTPEGASDVPVVSTTPVVPSEPIPVSPAGDNTDIDNDGLTSAEELSFRTDVARPDTDSDGYKDGEEILNLFSPIGGQRAFLNVSGLVQLYKNDTFGYTTWLPQDWVHRSLDESDVEAVLTSPTGDSVLVEIEPNSQNSTLEQWYATTFGATATTAVRRITIAERSALESADGLSWYLIDGQSIYRVTYDAATSGVINYPTVFILIRQTFSFPLAQ